MFTFKALLFVGSVALIQAAMLRTSVVISEAELAKLGNETTTEGNSTTSTPSTLDFARKPDTPYVPQRTSSVDSSLHQVGKQNQPDMRSHGTGGHHGSHTPQSVPSLGNRPNVHSGSHTGQVDRTPVNHGATAERGVGTHGHHGNQDRPSVSGHSSQSERRPHGNNHGDRHTGAHGNVSSNQNLKQQTSTTKLPNIAGGHQHRHHQ